MSVFLFPFIEGFHVGSFRAERILPGGSLRFPFISIDTGMSTPLGTVIYAGNGNLLFQNIPTSTPDPNVDFFVPISNVAIATAVPEANSIFLLAVAAVGLISSRPPARIRLPHGVW